MEGTPPSEKEKTLNSSEQGLDRTIPFFSIIPNTVFRDVG